MRTSEYERRLEVLRREIKAGIDALERGKFDEVNDSDLDEYLDNLTKAKKP